MSVCWALLKSVVRNVIDIIQLDDYALFILLKEACQLYFHSLGNRKIEVTKKIDTNFSLELGNPASQRQELAPWTETADPESRFAKPGGGCCPSQRPETAILGNVSWKRPSYSIEILDLF